MSSLRLITGEETNAMLQAWAAARLVKDFNMPPASMISPDNMTIGVLRNGKLIACAVYYGYQPWFGQIQMSIVADSPLWCNRGVVAALLAYPFRLGCQRIWVMTKEKNDRIIRLLKWCGFVREGTLVGFFGYRQNGISWRMMKSDYTQFLKRVGREGSSGCKVADQKAVVQKPLALAS